MFEVDLRDPMHLTVDRVENQFHFKMTDQVSLLNCPHSILEFIHRHFLACVIYDFLINSSLLITAKFQ